MKMLAKPFIQPKSITAKTTPRSLKVTSAIHPDPKYILPLRERSMHTLHFYSNRFKRGRPEWTWASLICQVLFPKWPRKEIGPKLHKDCEAVWKKATEVWQDLGLAATIAVRKDMAKKRFVATVPMIGLPENGYPEGLGALAIAVNDKNAMLDDKWRELVLDHLTEANSEKVYDLNSLQPSGNLRPLDVGNLENANAKLIVRKLGVSIVAFLQLEFSQREAEYLCNSAWLEIRPLDFYGVIRAWVDGRYGASARSPAFSLPLGRIAKHSDAKQSTPRLSEDGILLDEHASMMALPRNLNDINGYEEAAASAYAQDDGTFSALSEDGKKFKTPPAAMPVYIDWVNLKFAYTNLDGKLEIQNLDRSQPFNVTHAYRFLTRTMSHKVALNFLSYTIRLADFLHVVDPTEATTLNKDVIFALTKYNQQMGLARNIEQTPLVAIYEGSKSNDILKSFCTVALKVEKFIDSSPRNAYAKYSVPTIVQLLAELRIFNKYAPKFAEVQAQDTTRRQAYINQGVDPDFKLEPVPFILPDRGLMPHQNNIQNLLRDVPDNAVIPVDAGGGKCLHGDTLVHTSAGLLTLKEIYDTYAGAPSKIDSRFRRVKGDLEVLNLQGQQESVHQVFKRRGNLWELRLDDGTSFKGLKEHRFWTDDGWKQIGELKTGDWLCAPNKIDIFGTDHTIDISTVKTPEELYAQPGPRVRFASNFEAAQKIHNRLGGKLKTSQHLGFVLGALIAEGAGADFCNTDDDFIEQYLKSYEKVFGVLPSVTNQGSRHDVGKDLWMVVPASQYDRQVLMYLMGDCEDMERRYSHEKRVPRCIRESSKTTQKAFLSAWFEGDGEIRGIEGNKFSTRLSGSSISVRLCTDIIQMLRSFGVQARGGKPNTKKTYRTSQGGRGEIIEKIGSGVTVPTNQLELFQEQIGFASARKRDHLSKCIRRQNRGIEKYAQAARNIVMLGRNNRVPASIVTDVLDSIDEFAKTNLSYTVEYVNRWGGVSEEVRTHSLTSLMVAFRRSGEDALTRPQYAVNSKGKNTQSTRYAAESVFAFARKHPLLKNLRKQSDFQDKLGKLKQSLSCVWTKVESVINLKKTDFVYDLSLPSHSYTANGYFSHNTSIIVYETLKVMKTLGDRLCLVMCPSHLVAQYVKEFVYFTGIKVNVIPITSYTIRRHGLARLQVMIQHAPPNTILVTDYNAIVYKSSVISYGVAPIRLFPIIEFIRQFDIAYVACDESHYLKNGSSRNAAAARLLIEIQKKRLASGTMVADTMVDLVRQTALMDPSIFGTVDDFVNEYALETSGSKVKTWKPGAHLAIQRVIKNNIVSAGAKRKEWAAILPWPVERFHKTSMSPHQMRVYMDILTNIREQLEKAAMENEALKRLLKGEEDPDNPELNIDAMLKPYLARLERYMTAPGKDILGKEVLKGEDLVSPKVRKIIEICEKHLADGIPGKVLIFTNYEFSAQAIYEAFPPDMQKQVIYYTAANKDECGAEFEKNPKKTIMVGIEQSMNTGLNLQFCSRLIRVETVWTPGVLEQGNSRIGRPNIKEKEARKEIYYDWILTNKSIDVTKISYLMAKTISKAKFDEAGNPKFDELEVPDLFKMNLDTVFEMNDIDETLVEYFNHYEAYKQALHGEYELYRTKYKDRLFDKTGKLKMAMIEEAAPMKEAAIMRTVPYVPGTEIYGADKLGLVRYDAYMRLEEADLEDDDEEGDDEGGNELDEDNDDESSANAERREALRVEREKALGLAVHTEFGDGEIIHLNFKTLKVKLPSGSVFRVRKLAAFVITRDSTSNKDIRQSLLKMSGDLPISAPVDIPNPHIVKEGKRAQKEVQKKSGDGSKPIQQDDEETAIEMELDFTIVNDFLGVQLVNTDNEAAVSAAQALGFKYSPAYFAAKVPQPFLMMRQFKKWKDLEFEIDKIGNEACKNAFLHFKANKGSGINFMGVASKNDLKNFYRMEFKPNPSKSHIKPYPMYQDNRLYLCLPKVGHPGSTAAIQKGRISGLQWYSYDAGEDLIFFTPKKSEASSLIQSILREGIVITNMKVLKEKFSKLRVVRDAKSKDDE